MRIERNLQLAPPPARPAPASAPPPPAPPAHAGDQLHLSLGQRLKTRVRSLTGLVNQPLLNHFRGFLTSPEHQGAIKAVLAPMQQRQPLAAIEAQALQATLAQHPSSRAPAQLAALAYEALMAVAIETGYRDAAFFNGEWDKMMHYLTSAAFTAQTHANLPFAARDNERLAGGAVYGLGWIKEALSLPFSAEDLAANQRGIAAAKETIKTLRWQQQLLRPWPVPGNPP